MCDETFGEENFVACVVWQRNYAPISLKKYFSESHEYAFVYAKNIDVFQMNLLPRSEKQDKDYKNPDNDPRGVWKVGNLTVGPAVEKQIYEITGPTGRKFMPPSGYCWRFSKEKFEEMRKDNRIWFGADGSNSPVPKLFLSEVQAGVTPMTLWTYDEAGHNQIATRELRDIFDASVFTSPKPVKYLTRYLQLGCNKNDLILDFFSGSATLAHAIMQLNAEDGGNRKFIMVQLPEMCDQNSEASKAGYSNICEIGKERIRRIAKKISNEKPLFAGDIGFKVFKLDTSNLLPWNPNADELEQNLFAAVDNVLEGRTTDDLLHEILLKCNLPLTLPIETKQCGSNTIYLVGAGALAICLDKNIPATIAEEIVRLRDEYAPIVPMQVVFRDNGFNDVTKTNALQILKQAGFEEKSIQTI